MLKTDLVTAYKARAIQAIKDIKVEEVERLLEALCDVRERGAAVYVVGNGGSYANAAHLVLHLRDVGIRAFDLMADNAWLTAESNDHSYQSAAVRLLSKLVKEADVLLVISGGGNSDNILMLLGGFLGTKLALLGFGGGVAHDLCNVALTLPQTTYGPVEDAHSVVIHMLHEALK